MLVFRLQASTHFDIATLSILEIVRLRVLSSVTKAPFSKDYHYIDQISELLRPFKKNKRRSRPIFTPISNFSGLWLDDASFKTKIRRNGTFIRWRQSSEQELKSVCNKISRFVVEVKIEKSSFMSSQWPTFLGKPQERCVILSS